MQALSSDGGVSSLPGGTGPLRVQPPSSRDLFLPTSPEIMFKLPVADRGGVLPFTQSRLTHLAVQMVQP